MITYILISQFQAGERQLRPHRKESTPVELLMEDIRSCKAKTSLRKTAGPPTRHLCKSSLLKCCSLMIYSSDSQPGVHVPLGVRLKFTGGTQTDCRKVTTFKSTGKEPILVFFVPKICHFFVRGYNLCQIFI